MESPILIEIKAITVGVQKQNLFTLKVSLKTPTTETDDAGATAKAGSARKS